MHPPPGRVGLDAEGTPAAIPAGARGRTVAHSSTAVLASALCAGAITLAYGPLAFFRFAHTDDYALLMIHGYRAVNPFWMGDGRVLGGLLCAALFTLFDTVSSAAALRLIGLVEFLMCAVLIQRAAHSVGFAPVWAALSTVLFAASPSVQNWMIWGVSSWQMPALILGLLAYGPWRRTFDDRGRLSLGNVIASVSFQVAAMLIYQPFALAAWPFIGLALAAEQDRPSALRRGLLSVGVLAAVLVVTLLLTKGMTALFVPPGGHDRTEVATFAQLPGKFWWLADVLYPTVLSYGATSPVWAVSLPMVALIALHLTAQMTASWRILFVPTAVVTAAIAAALPSLATPETTPIRTFVVPALLACLLAGSTLQGLSRVWRPGKVWIIGVTGAACAITLGWAGYETVVYVAIPQSTELSSVEGRLAREPLPEGRPIILVGPPLTTSLTGRYCGIAMIGCASSSRRQSLPNMVRLWLRDHGRDVRSGLIFFTSDPNASSVFSFEPDQSKEVPRPVNPYVLDFRQLG